MKKLLYALLISGSACLIGGEQPGTRVNNPWLNEPRPQLCECCVITQSPTGRTAYGIGPDCMAFMCCLGGVSLCTCAGPLSSIPLIKTTLCGSCGASCAQFQICATGIVMCGIHFAFARKANTEYKEDLGRYQAAMLNAQLAQAPAAQVMSTTQAPTPPPRSPSPAADASGNDGDRQLVAISNSADTQDTHS